MSPSPLNMETNVSSDFASQSSKLNLTPGTTSVTHTAGSPGDGDRPESTNNSHSNGRLMPATSVVPIEEAPHPDFLAATWSSFDADSSLHGRLQDAPHQHPNPYSRIGCYTVKAQQLIDHFDERFDSDLDNSALDKPV